MHCRGAASLELPHFTHAFVAGHHVCGVPKLADDFGGAPLVLRVGVRMQEMDHHGLDAPESKLLDRSDHILFMEGLDDAAVRIHPLTDFDPVLSLDERSKGARQTVRVGTCASAQLKYIPEPLGRDQSTASTLVFEHSIGSGGRTVDEPRDLGRRDAQPGDSFQKTLRPIVDRGRHLGGPEDALVAVDKHEVRERATDVDSNID
ncbi:hypothetical protein D3C71_1341670 [compost metagenome]